MKEERDIVAEWMKKDPYLMDADGFKNFMEESLRPKRKRGEPKPPSFSYRPESQQWFKDLEELDNRLSGEKNLAHRIHEEILVKGEQFTKDNADAFKEGTELLSKLMMIHETYIEIHEKSFEQNSFGGKWGDMFGEWLILTGRLNVRGGQFLTPPNIAHFMAKMIMGGKEELESKVALICDPASGTGRFMLDTAEHYAETIRKLNFVFVNIDIDFQVYVYCAMNAVLNGIPAITIWGDSLGLPENYNEAIVTIPIGTVAMWKLVKKEDIPQALARANYLVEMTNKESEPITQNTSVQ
jgi:hypothetical protein